MKKTTYIIECKMKIAGETENYHTERTSLRRAKAIMKDLSARADVTELQAYELIPTTL